MHEIEVYFDASAALPGQTWGQPPGCYRARLRSAPYIEARAATKSEAYMECIRTAGGHVGFPTETSQYRMVSPD